MLICPWKESYVITYSRVHFGAELALDQLDTLGRRSSYSGKTFAALQGEENEIEGKGRNVCGRLAVRANKIFAER